MPILRFISDKVVSNSAVDDNIEMTTDEPDKNIVEGAEGKEVEDEKKSG